MTQPAKSESTPNNTVTWKSPSNIAIVKYWGKKEGQIPMNASISMTLSQSYTETEVRYRTRQSDERYFEFYFNQKPQPSFEPKLESFFRHAFEQLPLLKQYHFTISSFNTFPHSAGIASSASAMSALALCLCQINQQLVHPSQAFDLKTAGALARLGSGSACRSLIGGWAMWGAHQSMPQSNDHYAISLNDMVHPLFRDYADTILVIDENKKSVSSSAGHQMMNHHPYKQGRLEQAKRNIDLTIDALKTGDAQLFSSVCEEEALSLHALMMSSNPGFTLIKAQTLTAIEKIRDFRQQHHIPVCFTLDAGPNIHLLYPMAHKQNVNNFIESELKQLCHNQMIINDHLGSGPKNI